MSDLTWCNCCQYVINDDDVFPGGLCAGCWNFEIRSRAKALEALTRRGE